MTTVTLYHGTTPESAEALLENGWQPSKNPSGGSCGQTRYLYLSTGYEDALWFAQEKGSDIVLEIADVDLEWLQVDPEDGTYDTVEEEIRQVGSGFPGKVVLFKPLEAGHFSTTVPVIKP